MIVKHINSVHNDYTDTVTGYQPSANFCFYKKTGPVNELLSKK